MADGEFLSGLSLRARPANLMAEAAVLGALLANNRAREQCLALSPEDFSDPDYARLYAWVIGDIDLGRRVDAISLRGQFEPQLIADVVASMVSLVIDGYVREIKDCGARRSAIDICEALVTEAFAGGDTTSMLSNAATRIDEVMSGSGRLVSGVTLTQALDRAVAAIEEARDRKGPAGISTGFPTLDERIGGLEPGTLTVIAGRPGMGKSALGWQIALNAAVNKIGVLAISLEMSAVELGRRALASFAGVPVTAMKYGRVNIEQGSNIKLAQRRLRDLPLMIEDSAGQSAAVIAARARSMRRKGLGLIMIDHLHIVRPEDADARQGATWAIGRISGAMKRLAKDCECPVLLLAQLNRGVEGRDDKRPGLGDLRQAGDIEQDADAVGFVYRPEYYLGSKPERKSGEAAALYDARVATWQDGKADAVGKAELIWSKIRDGQPGTDALIFDGPTTAFREEGCA
jgi:replicative DNA helicase